MLIPAQKPTKDKKLPRYYKIPGFDQYLISKEGEVLSKKTWKHIKPHYNQDGYLVFSLNWQRGIKRHISQHRLMMLVFKHPGNDADLTKLTVNHKNGIKDNNTLKNLEWTTYFGNIQHSIKYKLRHVGNPISLRHVLTGEIHNFPGIAACIRFLKVTKDSIKFRLRAGEHRVWPDMYQIRKTSDKPWYIPSKDEIELARYGIQRGVCIKHLKTNKYSVFKKMTDAAKFLGISNPTLSAWLKRPNQPVLEGFIQVKWIDDLTPWRPVGDMIAELGQWKCDKPVVVINAVTGERKMFDSAIKCAGAMGLKATGLNYRLKSKGKTIFKDGYRYAYYTDLNETAPLGPL